MEERIAVGRRRYARLWRRWAVRVLAAGMAVSLLLHMFELYVIVRGRQLARQQIIELAAQIEAAENSTLSVPIELRQQVPVSANVPIEKQISVPINTTVSISESIDIPFDTPLGTYSVPVPLNLDVPIHTSVPIAISETLAVSTAIDLDLRVPLSIPVAETSLAGYLSELRARLVELADQL